MLSRGLLAICLTLCCRAADDPAVRAVLEKIKASQPQLDKRMESFGYRERAVEVNGSKVTSRETFEVTYYRGIRLPHGYLGPAVQFFGLTDVRIILSGGSGVEEPIELLEVVIGSGH